MKLLEFALVAAFAAAMVLGVYWVLWSLWCWVMPQLWATGPDNVVRPGFWLFSGVWLLIAFLGRAMFGGGK